MKLANRFSVQFSVLAGSLLALAGVAVAEEKTIVTDKTVTTTTTTKSDRTAGQVVDDGWVNGKVKTALIADSRTKAHQINVSTRAGVVTLDGLVDTLAAKNAATEVAESIEGVKAVDNNLKVKG